MKTAAVVNWTDVYTHLIETSATDYIRSANDSFGTYMLEEILQNQDFDLIFWGNDDVDKNGHLYGFDPSVPQYLAAVEEKDSQIQRLMDAINSRATRNDEEWLITITSDHAGVMAGHQWLDEPCRKIPLFFHGDVLRQGKILADCETDLSQMDVFPSIMEWLRIPVEVDWDIDGKSRLDF